MANQIARFHTIIFKSESDCQTKFLALTQNVQNQITFCDKKYIFATKNIISVENPNFRRNNLREKLFILTRESQSAMRFISNQSFDTKLLFSKHTEVRSLSGNIDQYPVYTRCITVSNLTAQRNCGNYEIVFGNSNMSKILSCY